VVRRQLRLAAAALNPDPVNVKKRTMVLFE
jgi:hypothetical protein